jgi:tetratricopeptide (TPR) repeat protein
VNCSNGEALASTEVQANDKNHVLDALGKMATEMRSKLGESLASVQKYDAPPENVTTPSLDALKAYSLGYKEAYVKTDYATAIPLFQRAASIDPNFAMAYAQLGNSYYDLAETARAAEAARKAYELRERVSEREKLYIDSHYEQLVMGNLDAARKPYELWAQTYLRDDVPPTNLASVYINLGSYDKALTASQEALKLNPDDGTASAAEFQKIIDHPGVVLNEPIGALAHLQIGRAYAMQADSTKAKAAYQDFLALWKDADPDIPILKQAKSEYAKLQ